MTFGARALIRLGALNKNLSVIRGAAPGAKVMAVVKANAYGHGMSEVANSLADVEAFGVARLPEAIALRESGVGQPIVLLEGPLAAPELDDAIAHSFEIVVHCEEQLELLEAAQGGAVVVWLKFDTGMNRLGFAPDQVTELIERARGCGTVAELRLMSHLANADELASGFDGAVSIANSAATLGWPKIAGARDTLGFTGAHWIRPGLALYGVSPFEGRTGQDLGLTPVMQFEARLIARKPLREGARVGYKGTYRATHDSVLGVVAAGYGDGYTRQLRTGTPVLINGRRVPLIGHVSMDMIAVDLGPDSEDSVGDIATLWGDGLPVEEVASWAGAAA